MNTIPVPLFTTATTTAGRWTFMISNTGWKHMFYRNTSFATKKEAEKMARNCKKVFVHTAKAIEAGTEARCFIIREHERFIGKFSRVARSMSDGPNVTF